MSSGSNDKKPFAPSKIQFAYFSMIMAWAANILFLFISSNPEIIMSTKEGIRLADFFTFYEAAKLSASGDKLYELGAQLRWTNQIIAPLHVDQAWPLVYPPMICLLLTPLSNFSLDGAFTFWKFLSVPFGLTGVYILLTSQTRFNNVSRAAIMLSVIANTPAIFAIRTGSFSFILLCLLSLYVWGLLKNRNIMVGICLALMAAIKPNFAVFLLVPLFFPLRWKALTVTGLTMLGLVCASIAHFGVGVFSEYSAYLNDVFSSSNKYAPITFPEYQVNLRALILYHLLHWTTPVAVTVFTTVCCLFGLAMSALVWLKARGRQELFGWSMAFTLLMLLLCGPHVHHYDVLLLVVAAALTLPSVSFSDVVKVKERAYRYWCYLFLLYPMVSFITFSLSVFNQDLKLVVILFTNIALAITGFLYLTYLWKSPVDASLADLENGKQI